MPSTEVLTLSKAMMSIGESEIIDAAMVMSFIFFFQAMHLALSSALCRW